MPRPRKGDRVELLTRPERIVSDKIKLVLEVAAIKQV